MCIISFSRNFIFVKTTKTAGTSLEVFLQRHCSERDVVTPILPRNPNHRPRNYRNFFGKAVYYNHMPMTEIRQRVGKSFFSSAYKFCFERHPIDKCLSHFAMLVNSPDHKVFESGNDWEKYLAAGDFPIDIEKYTDVSGTLLVDRVYKYEALSDAITELGDRLDLPDVQLDVFEKSGFRAGIPTFEDVASNAEQTAVIMEAFSKTMEIADYDQ